VACRTARAWRWGPGGRQCQRPQADAGRQCGRSRGRACGRSGRRPVRRRHQLHRCRTLIGNICAHENRPCNRYRTFTIANACNFTVWPATRSNIPVAGGGFKLAAGTSVDVSVPDGWIGNWSPRTGCLFDAQGRGACEVGDCGGLLACDGDADIMPSDHTVVSVRSAHVPPSHGAWRAVARSPGSHAAAQTETCARRAGRVQSGLVGWRRLL